jgi:hypothetical protein
VKRIGRRRLTLGAIAAFPVLIAVAWFGDLASAIPFDVHENGGGEPLLQSPAVALALVERALVPYGGLPHDAQLTGSASEQASATLPSAATAPGTGTSFDFTFQPRDALLWKDRILAQVEAVTQQTCADGGTLPLRYGARPEMPRTCGRYTLTFPLHVTWLKRAWRPWIVRRVGRWAGRAFAPAVAAPASVTTTCPRPPDVGALRRIVAAADGPDVAMSQIFDSEHTEPLWTRAAQQPGATIARWDPPYPTLPLRPPAEIVAAVVVDAPRLGIAVRFARPIEMGRPGLIGPSVLTFSTTDEEPVCGLSEPAAPDPPLTRAAPAWDSVVAAVLQRSKAEVHWRTSWHRAPMAGRVVAVNRHAGAVSTIDVETTQPADGRWHARFTVDERVPEIREAEFVRAGG